MKVLVLTSCTSKKVVRSPRQLTLEDFQKGEEHLKERHKGLRGCLRPALRMYKGRQHLLLREALVHCRGKVQVDVKIVSAGYGLLDQDTEIAPYEATFTDMLEKDRRAWGAHLHLPEEVQTLLTLAKGYDLCLVLLGETYLQACAFERISFVGCPTVVFCSKGWASTLSGRQWIQPVPLDVSSTKKFREGLTSIKGKLGGRILDQVVRRGESASNWIREFMTMSPEEAVEELGRVAG